MQAKIHVFGESKKKIEKLTMNETAEPVRFESAVGHSVCE